jgi:uncharacterized membrane protein YdjX (TVP38/TMEM64 family)
MPDEQTSSPAPASSPDPESPRPTLGAQLRAGWAFVKELGPAGVLGAISLTLPPLGSIALFTYMNTVGEWFRSHQGVGIALYIGGFVVLAGLALMPTYASAILGGWAFGFAWGFPAALAGFGGAALLSYFVARKIAHDRVEKVIAARPKWATVRQALVGGSAGKTLAIITLMRLPPNSPFAATNLVLASVRVHPLVFLCGTLLGMAPRTGVAVYLAAKVQNMVAERAVDAVKEQTPWWVLAISLAAGFAFLGVIGLIANNALKRMTANTPA